MIGKISDTAFLYPDWPVASRVKTLLTTRQAGASEGVFRHFNLASHVGDDDKAVKENRSALMARVGCPIQWLNQVHGSALVTLEAVQDHPYEADALYTDRSMLACAVQTADCLPILLCNREGSEIAAIHAGWRGLAQGIVSKCVAHFKAPESQMLAWLGPAISQQNFAVGGEVREAFLQNRDDLACTSAEIDDAFKAISDGKYLADLYQLARATLKNLGVRRVYGGGYCTYNESARFYSWRREKVTGRMASLIWMEPGVCSELPGTPPGSHSPDTP